jgi:pyrimidine operon attenuation protein/uracil phosphoribosyltransferase
MDQPQQQIFNADDIDRVVSRMAQEIRTRNEGVHNIVLVGIHRRGVPLAQRIAAALVDAEGYQVPVGQLDVTLYRDDKRTRQSTAPMYRTIIPTDITGRVVVLVDSVFSTGRTARAALNALIDIGHPSRIQLAVLVDRGLRELPIRADFVGQHVPVAREEAVAVYLQEVDNREDEVCIVPIADAAAG